MESTVFKQLSLSLRMKTKNQHLSSSLCHIGFGASLTPAAGGFLGRVTQTTFFDSRDMQPWSSSSLAPPYVILNWDIRETLKASATKSAGVSSIKVALCYKPYSLTLPTQDYEYPQFTSGDFFSPPEATIAHLRLVQRVEAYRLSYFMTWNGQSDQFGPRHAVAKVACHSYAN